MLLKFKKLYVTTNSYNQVTEGGDVELTAGERLTIDTSTYDPEFNRQESKIVLLERGVYVSGRYGCQWNTKDMAVREEMVVAVRSQWLIIII